MTLMSEYIPKHPYKLLDWKNTSKLDRLIIPSNELSLLPVTHRMSAFDLADTLESLCIEPTECDVFYSDIDEHGKYIKEQLCYLFYGRNDYKPSFNGTSQYYLPTCFIFDYSQISVDVAFPFDTGGYADERYRDYISLKWDVNRFQFSPTQGKITGFIKQVYGSNENYLDSKPQISVDIQRQPTILNVLVDLYSAQANENFDKRANCIELISRKAIPFENALRAIILPSIFYAASEDEPYIKKLEQEDGVTILQYENVGNFDEEALNDLIKEKIIEYYKSTGVLSSYGMFK